MYKNTDKGFSGIKDFSRFNGLNLIRFKPATSHVQFRVSFVIETTKLLNQGKVHFASRGVRFYAFKFNMQIRS